MAELIATGQYEPVDHDLSDPLRYGHTLQIPRLRCRTRLGIYSHLTLWSETAYHLSCDAAMVEVPDFMAWNVVLVEDEFDPVGPDADSISYHSRQAAGIRILHWVLSQTAVRRRPIYVPSIPVFIDALLDQQRYRLAHPENYPDRRGTLPSYHLSNFIRYLFLESGHRRDRILSKLAPRNLLDMETRMNRSRYTAPAVRDENSEPPPVEERAYAASNLPQDEIKELGSTPAAEPAAATSTPSLQAPAASQHKPTAPGAWVNLVVTTSGSGLLPALINMKTTGENHKSALLEAFMAAVQLVPKEMRSGFLLLGGTCLIALGSDRETEDVDIGVSAQALQAFMTAAKVDRRFSVGPTQAWTYTCQAAITVNICVRLQFLTLGGGKSDETFQGVELDDESKEILREAQGKRYDMMLRELLKRKL
ncbi:MAG: hypothetical protein M1826_006816 [Phylliscum demangeonii]|nr:MAG: hypothetical protein M1826_006816 [Phylliscum demangeonii]